MLRFTPIIMSIRRQHELGSSGLKHLDNTEG